VSFLIQGEKRSRLNNAFFKNYARGLEKGLKPKGKGGFLKPVWRGSYAISQAKGSDRSGLAAAVGGRRGGEREIRIHRERSSQKGSNIAFSDKKKISLTNTHVGKSGMRVQAEKWGEKRVMTWGGESFGISSRKETSRPLSLTEGERNNPFLRNASRG